MIAKRPRWQLQEAKAHLSELVREACGSGPQTITVRGEVAVVVVSASDFEKLTAPTRSMFEMLRSSPVREEDVDTIFARAADLPEDHRPIFEDD